MPRGAPVPYYSDGKKNRVEEVARKIWRCESCGQLTTENKEKDTCCFCGTVRNNNTPLEKD